MNNDEEREALEKRIFTIIRDFEERTGEIVSKILFVREELSRPASEGEASVLRGVRVELE